MSAVLLAAAGASGVYLLYTAAAFGWRSIGVTNGEGAAASRRRLAAQDWLTQAGLAEVRPRDFAVVVLSLFIAGAAAGVAVFGSVVPAVATAAGAASLPVAMYRARRDRRRAEAREAWPRLIEEIRLRTGAMGRSIPQALFEAGGRGPRELRPAFAAGEREWLMATDFARTCRVLKHQLADSTADAALETLLVAHEVGGSDLDRRLVALIEDRVQDLQGRKDARAKQAGVRFARRFVLIVPVGMAFAGLSIGTGRDAYQTAQGQAAVVVGIALVSACWAWAGRLLRLPEEDRVFHG